MTFETIPLTYTFQLRSKDIVAPITVTCLTRSTSCFCPRLYEYMQYVKHVFCVYRGPIRRTISLVFKVIRITSSMDNLAAIYNHENGCQTVQVIGLYRDVWIAAITRSRTSLETHLVVKCTMSQCKLRSLRAISGMGNVICIVT